MFGREKTPAAVAPETAAPTSAVETGVGKGRPTPKRKVAQQANRRPVVAGPRAAQTKEERKAAKDAQRLAARSERVQARAALAGGDERYLPARDQGPARRWARQYVDSRYNPSDFMLPVVMAAVLLSLVGVQGISVIAMLLLYAIVLLVAGDLFLLRRRVQKKVDERFPKESAGVGTYAMMRALQMRRSRLPRPQGKRGTPPA